MAARVFHIDGGEYEIPSLDTFTMDEAEVFFGLTGVAPEEVWIQHITGEDGKVEVAVRSPAFVRSLMEVAYRRGNPDATEANVHDLVAKISYIEAITDLVASVKEDAVLPLASTTETQESSENERNESNGSSSSSSGKDSTNGSVALEATLEPTGALR